MRFAVALCSVLVVVVGAAPALAADRGPVASITGETLDGKRLSLGDLRGKPVVINVWSSW